MSAQEQTPVRVLVVDDSFVQQYILCALVSETPGFEVVGITPSGREALDLLAVTDAQLVLLDAQMPGLDGIETARQMRDRHPDVVVLLLTEAGGRLRTEGLSIEGKGDLSPRGLAEFWERHRPSR